LRYRDAWKLWHVRECVLTGERLAYYKAAPGASLAGEEPEGFVMVAGCSVDVRQSKKEANCFKISHPSKKAHKGARMSYDHIILAVDKDVDLKTWIAAVETAINYASAKPATKQVDVSAQQLAVPATPSVEDSESEDTAVLEKKKSRTPTTTVTPPPGAPAGALDESTSGSTTKRKKKKDANDNDAESTAASSTVAASEAGDADSSSAQPTSYQKFDAAAPGAVAGGASEELGQEGKSIFLTLLKQVRPGMDLSKVVLPTFILEPRSMLEKLTDFMSHSDILMRAPTLADPLERMLAVVKFYVSGFYIKPAGVKKPYNPIIGETFRCMWQYEDGSKTFYVAEQVSHHPPISAFYAQNRQAGVVIDGSILFGSKFMGTSAASTLNGYATIHFPKHGEEYRFSFPDAHAKGFIVGPLLMELVGVMTISCEQTGYKCELDFKSKGFWSGEYNTVAGKVKRGEDVLYTIAGKWDESLSITDNNTKQQQVLFAPENHTRLPKYKPVWDELAPKESDKLWLKVGEAIRTGDQKAATDEKYVLEQAQREIHKELKEQNRDWVPRWFAKDATERWVYKWFTDGLKLLDPVTEAGEFESGGRFFAVAKGDESEASERTRRRKHRTASRMIDSPATIIAAGGGPPSPRRSVAASTAGAAAAAASVTPSRSVSTMSAAASPSSYASPAAAASSSNDSEVRSLKSRVEKLETQVTRLTSQLQHAGGGASKASSLAENKTVVFALLVLAMYTVSTLNLAAFLIG
jgi:hypothetical protein